jgi:hypothetical protein
MNGGKTNIIKFPQPALGINYGRWKFVRDGETLAEGPMNEKTRKAIDRVEKNFAPVIDRRPEPGTSKSLPDNVLAFKIGAKSDGGKITEQDSRLEGILVAGLTSNWKSAKSLASNFLSEESIGTFFRRAADIFAMRPLRKSKDSPAAKSNDAGIQTG